MAKFHEDCSCDTRTKNIFQIFNPVKILGNKPENIFFYMSNLENNKFCFSAIYYFLHISVLLQTL